MDVFTGTSMEELESETKKALGKHAHNSWPSTHIQVDVYVVVLFHSVSVHE